MGDIITKERVFKTLMVKSDVEVVRSDVLAEVFGKRHEDVLRKIRAEIIGVLVDEGYIDDVKINGKVLSHFGKIPVQEFEKLVTEFSAAKKDIEKYFITGTRKVNTRNEKVYYLTEKGFSLVALGFTGSAARQYRKWYIDGYHKMRKVIMEEELRHRINHETELWLSQRESTKPIRRTLTDIIKEYVVDYRLNVEGKQNDGRYYMHYTKLVYSILGYSKPLSKKQRDVLGVKELNKLKETEDHVAQLIEKYSKEGMHYRDVYKKIKSELHPK